MLQRSSQKCPPHLAFHYHPVFPKWCFRAANEEEFLDRLHAPLVENRVIDGMLFYVRWYTSAIVSQ